jgi:hypothetical protein
MIIATELAVQDVLDDMEKPALFSMVIINAIDHFKPLLVGDNRDLKKADLFWKLLVESTMDGGNLLPESDSQSDTQDVLKKRTINKKYSWLQKLAVRCDAKRSLMLAAKRKF